MEKHQRCLINILLPIIVTTIIIAGYASILKDVAFIGLFLLGSYLN